MRIAILGLGEAGRFYAEGFGELGAEVSGYDPMAATTPDGVHREDSVAAAVATADYVVSLVGAAVSQSVLNTALSSMATRTVFADLNTGSPEQKRALAAIASDAGVPFVDVAVMAPVPRAGVRTPLLASGPGADRLCAEWSELGVPVTHAGREAGSAASRKMLRSIFMKGLAALVLESASAAELAGARSWMLDEMAGELGADGGALVDRLIEGTRTHAARREHEMRDVRDYLETLDAPIWMTQATIQWLHAVAQEPAFPSR